MLPPVAELNTLDETAATTALASLFEGAPAFVRRIARDRPYASYDLLLDHAREIALALPEAKQVELLDAHPRIGAAPGSVSALSFREQGYDRDRGTAALQAELDGLNARYEKQFGFRFVIFVAGRPRSAIVPIMEQCLAAAREVEKERALRDVIEIARDRVARLTAEEGP